MRRDEEFAEFARARQQRMYRQAYLLCGDAEQARDLVQTALLKLYRAWPRVSKATYIDAYSHKTLVRTYLEGLRRSRRERQLQRLPEPPRSEGSADLLERAVEPLDTMPDAVPDVIVKGHRSVRIRRATAAAATIAGAAAGVAAVISVMSLAAGPAAGPPAAGSGSTASASASGLPADLVTFNRDVLAPALERALPSGLGTVSVSDHVGTVDVSDRVGEFVITGAKTYELQFSVNNRPQGYRDQIFSCSEYTNPAPGEPDQYPSCAERTLPDGMRAAALEEDIDQSRGGLVALRARTIYHGKLVELSLYPSEEKPRRVPITKEQMLDALANASLATAYHQWANRAEWVN